MFVYLFIIIVELLLFLVLFFFLLYFLSMIISDFFGVPFVPTRQKTLEAIFAEIKIKKTDVFYDLGCGDGRLVFFVKQHFEIKATGIELNPLLNAFSQIKAHFLKLKQVSFIKKSFFEVDLSKATIIYMFLFPEVVERLSAKLRKECRRGTILISHGFKLKWLEKNLFRELPGKPFATYYYRL